MSLGESTTVHPDPQRRRATGTSPAHFTEGVGDSSWRPKQTNGRAARAILATRPSGQTPTQRDVSGGREYTRHPIYETWFRSNLLSGWRHQRGSMTSRAVVELLFAVGGDGAQAQPAEPYLTC